MYNAPVPPPSELPSSRALLRSTLVALGIAAVLLVGVIIPAEYAVDPTGFGRLTGLQRMGEIKMALAKEAAVADSAEVDAGTVTAEGAVRKDSITVSLAPGKGIEVKVAASEGVAVKYQWTVAGGVVNHDTHGDPVNAPRGFYHGYSRGTAMASDQGVLVAAFDGKHGWFWRNRGAEPVTVTLLVASKTSSSFTCRLKKAKLAPG